MANNNETSSDDFVEKRFKLNFRDFDPRCFVPFRSCSICDSSFAQVTSVRQLEPTFATELVPEYDFDHVYDFVVAEMKFNNHELTEQLLVSLELHVCRKTLFVSLVFKGRSPLAFASLQATSSMATSCSEKLTQFHQINEECLKLTKSEKSRILSFPSKLSQLLLLRRGGLVLDCKVRIYYPWRIIEEPSCCRLRSDPQDNVQLESSTGQIILCPKDILIESSDVFERMFLIPMQESAKNRCQLPDFKTQVVRALVCFLQTGCLPKELTIEDFAELLILSEVYNLQKLKIFTEVKILGSISAQNCSEIFRLGSRFDAPMLKAGSLDWIRRYVGDLQYDLSE